MKRLLLPLLAVLALPTAVNADLGGADITGQDGSTTTGRVYDAWCGIDFKDCKVSFKNDLLSVNKSSGITRNQLVNVTMARVCRQKSLGGFGPPSCFKSQYNKEYSITYKNSENKERTASISFRHEPTYKSFNRDFQIWMGDVLREVGPSLKIEF